MPRKWFERGGRRARRHDVAAHPHRSAMKAPAAFRRELEAEHRAKSSAAVARGDYDAAPLRPKGAAWLYW